MSLSINKFDSDIGIQTLSPVLTIATANLSNVCQ